MQPGVEVDLTVRFPWCYSLA